jgi:glycosyltransferase involved in cell wall biosynthesis
MCALAILPGAGTVHLLMRSSSSSERKLKDSTEFLNSRIVASTMLEDICDPTAPSTLTAPLFVADWGQADLPGERDLRQLKGATLFFLDEDAGRHLDFRELARFSKLGVERLIWQSPHVPQETHDLEIKGRGWRQRLGSFLFLFPRRIATLASTPWMRLVLRATSLARSTDGLSSGFLDKIRAAPDQDLFAEYAVFEGLRQLPPVHSSHGDISTRGGGRYSIWNQVCYFSATTPGRERSSPYWVVPRSPKVDRVLPAVLTVRRFEADPAARDRLRRLLKGSSSEAVTLRSGDSVAIMTHGLHPGGAERQWVYLAKIMKARGFRVTFIVNSLEGTNGHYLPMLERLGISTLVTSDCTVEEQIRLWPQSEQAGAVLRSGIVPDRTKLMQTVVAFRMASPKVVFSQLDEPNLLAGFAGLVAGVERVVLSFRNVNPTNFAYLNSPWYLPAYAMLADFPRVRFSANSKAGAHDYEKWIGLPEGSVPVIPNALDPETFLEPAPTHVTMLRAELGIRSDDPVILGVFRLSEEKDPLAFVEVGARVVKDIPRARVLLAGVGPMRSLVEQRIDALGLGGNIRLLGQRSDVNALLRLANVLLLTSTIEGMPNVLMEAQLMGVPAVATNVGGVPDAVLPGETALLRPAGDVAGLADACTMLLRDTAAAARIGAAGRRFALERFSLDQLADDYVKVAERD